MAKTNNIHVVPRNAGWIVRKEGVTRATSVHPTQRQAVTQPAILHAGKVANL